jgi:hypothetical protein
MPFGPNIPNMSGYLTFDQFDNHGGTWVLSSIEVLLTLHTSGGQLVLDNDSDQPASGIFQFGAKGNIESNDVTLLNSSAQTIPGQAGAYHSRAFSLEPENGDGPNNRDGNSPDGLVYDGGTESGIVSGLVGSSYWTGSGAKGYLGTDTYDIYYSIFQWLDYGSIGGIEYAVTPVSASGDVTITYTYDVIPEPATITLLCLGTFALLKRKSSK